MHKSLADEGRIMQIEKFSEFCLNLGHKSSKLFGPFYTGFKEETMRKLKTFSG